MENTNEKTEKIRPGTKIKLEVERQAKKREYSASPSHATRGSNPGVDTSETQVWNIGNSGLWSTTESECAACVFGHGVRIG